jgi:hypothetical protein
VVECASPYVDSSFAIFKLAGKAAAKVLPLCSLFWSQAAAEAAPVIIAMTRSSFVSARVSLPTTHP